MSEIMTGQEWYNRFCKEVGLLDHEQCRYLVRNPEKLYEFMVDAAKRAAGIKL